MIDVSIISKIVSRKAEGKELSKTPSMPGSFLEKSIWDSIFELKVDTVGNRYLFGKLPLAIQYGITMFAEGDIKIPSLLDSIPIASTSAKGLAYFDPNYFSVGNDGKVSLIVGGQGIDETELEDYLTSNNYAKKSDIPSLVGYATESWVNTRIDSLINGAPAAYDTLKEIADVLQGNVNSIGDIITALGTKWTQDNTKIANWDTAYSWGNHANAGYALKTYVDDTFVTLGTTQTITGEKNFTGGIKVNGSPIYYDSTNKYWKLEGDLLVTGGVTMYGNDSEFTPSTIMDAIQTDGVTIRVNPTTKNLEVIGNTSGATTIGGLSNVGTWADSVADVDRIMYQAAGSSNWVAKSLSSIGGVSGDYLPLSGGTLKLKEITSLTVLRESSNDMSAIKFSNNGDGVLGYIGIGGSGNTHAKQPVFVDSTVRTYKIYHSGNFNPSDYLPISGGELSGHLTLVNDKAIQTYDSNGSTIQLLKAYYNDIHIAPSANKSGFKTYINGNDIYFRYGSPATIGMYLNSSGNVGIGMTDPQTSLHITGSKATPLSVNSTNDGESCMSFQLSRTSKAYIGYLKTYGAYMYNAQKDYYLSIKDDGSLFYSGGTIWHSGNDGSDSGLDADLLDGVQESGFCRHLDGVPITSHRGIGYGYEEQGWIGSGPALSVGYSGDNYLMQLQAPADYTALHFRNRMNGTWGSWKTIAFTDSNVASATKLQTARTIWGQSFDGSGNVDGNMVVKGQFVSITLQGTNSYNTGITFNDYEGNPRWYLSYRGLNATDKDFYIYRFTDDNSYHVALSLIRSNGNVGIGTTDPSNKLTVDGTILGNGIMSNGSNVVGQYPYIKLHIPGITWKQFFLRQDGVVELRDGGVEQLGERGTLAVGEFYSNSNGWFDGNLIAGGNVGIGTTSPSQKLHVNGNILATGGITMYSDQRKKTILGNVELSLKQIANAPLIEHYYNGDDKRTTHVGSIAQYWASMNDWFCKLDSEGYYTMEIQNAALASAISIARELDRYESKTDKTIKQLKKRICQLEEEIERLRAS